MSFTCFVSIEGEKQGKFKGEPALSKLGTEKITVTNFNSAINVPHDAASGQVSGKRQYVPVVFIKELGEASPQLTAAVVQNEVLKSVLFEFVRTTATGKEEVFYTIKLTNAHIVTREMFTETSLARVPAATRELERIGLTFQKIEVEHVVGKTTASDDWEVSQ